MSKYDALAGQNKLLQRQILPACKSGAVCHLTKKGEKKEETALLKQKNPMQPKAMNGSMCQWNLHFNGQIWKFLRITACMYVNSFELESGQDLGSNQIIVAYKLLLHFFHP